MTEENTAPEAFSSDFNLDEDVVAEPLIPNGVYYASITQVSIDPERMSLNITHTFADNEGVMNDGETPIDTATITQRIWFPKPGDEDLLTKSGKQTKRQWKINNLARVGKELDIELTTPQQIAEAVGEQLWVGKETHVTVETSEFNGDFKNDVKKAVAA